jgi:hypothetical protein
MNTLFKNLIILVSILFVAWSGFSLRWDDDFAKPLLEEWEWQFAWEKLVTIDWISYDRKISLADNIRKVFYPAWSGIASHNDSWILRDVIRNIMVGVLIFFFIRAWFKFLTEAEDEWAIKTNQMNLIYITVGAFVLFTATRIMGVALNLQTVEWVISDGWPSENALIQRAENNIFVVILWFLKGFAFFLAIIMLVRYGYQMIVAVDQEDKIDTAKKWILNVLMAIIFIKVIDFLYYIAQQPSFTTDAVELLVIVAKFLGYVFGILIVVVIIYIAFQFITGGEDWFKRWLNFLKNLVIVALLIFLFLLIVYQVLMELA